MEDCRTNGNLNLGNRKLPKFVNWNWAIIRKVMLWVVISGLVACLGAIIAMVATIPKSCNPDVPWYQGKVFYEIFPASFKDSNKDATGDLKGIIKQLDYLKALRVSAIRMNFIFQAHNYPDQYYNTTSLKDIDASIGVLDDFDKLVSAVHDSNMSVILDLPVWSIAPPVSLSSHNVTQARYHDPTSDAIDFWARKHNVDGFYLKNLEKFVNDEDFGVTLQLWKQIIGHDKILIASEHAYAKATGDSLNVLLSRIDLIDVHLDLKGNVTELKNRIKDVINGPLWSKPHYPWVLWNIGNIDSHRVTSKHVKNALVLTALEFVLPGTVSIFYGDEIGLEDLAIEDVEEDFSEHETVHNLVQMKFPNEKKENNALHWNTDSKSESKHHFLDVVKILSAVRLNTPTIYLRSIFKDGNMLKNMDIRDTEENLFVIERWYPRRNSIIFVGNLGNTSITTDLTAMFYGGTVIAGTNSSLIGEVMYFNQVTFLPNAAIILKLEK